MLDQIEIQIAKQLADHHNYPYGQEIYTSIFKAFSYFPLKLTDINLTGPGETITFLSLIVKDCFETKTVDIFSQYDFLLRKYAKTVAPLYPQDIAVETFLGCALYYYHPIQLRTTFTYLDTTVIFDKRQQYEYELKRKTILIYAI